MQNKGKQKLTVNYHYVDHHIGILGLDRDCGNVDVHEQAMLSTNTEKHAVACTLSIRKCMIGSFFMIHLLSHYSIEPGHSELLRTKTVHELKIVVQHPDLSKLRVP